MIFKFIQFTTLIGICLSQNLPLTQTKSSFMETKPVVKTTGKIYMNIEFDFNSIQMKISDQLKGLKALQNPPDELVTQLTRLEDLANSLLPKTRAKRQYLGLVALGLGLYDYNEIGKAENAIDQLKNNQVKMDLNTKTLVNHIHHDDHILNLTLQSVKEVFNLNALVHEEVQILSYQMQIQSDHLVLDGVKQMIESVENFGSWKSNKLDQLVMKHFGQTKSIANQKGIQLALENPFDAYTYLRKNSKHISIVFIINTYEGLWKAYQYIPIGLHLKDLEHDLLATNGSHFQVFTPDQWSQCKELGRGLICPNSNSYLGNDTEICLVALFQQDLSLVNRTCHLNLGPTSYLNHIRIFESEVFGVFHLSVETKATLKVTCPQHNHNIPLQSGAYRLEWSEGCQYQLGQWQRGHLDSLYMTYNDHVELEKVNFELTNGSIFEQMKLVQGQLSDIKLMPLAKLFQIQPIETHWGVDWWIYLIIALILAAVICLAVAYLVYRFRSRSNPIKLADSERADPILEKLEMAIRHAK